MSAFYHLTPTPERAFGQAHMWGYRPSPVPVTPRPVSGTHRSPSWRCTGPRRPGWRRSLGSHEWSRGTWHPAGKKQSELLTLTLALAQNGAPCPNPRSHSQPWPQAVSKLSRNPLKSSVDQGEPGRGRGWLSRYLLPHQAEESVASAPDAGLSQARGSAPLSQGPGERKGQAEYRDWK